MKINDIFVDKNSRRYIHNNGCVLGLQPTYAMIYKGNNTAMCYDGNEIVFNTLTIDMDNDTYDESSKDRFLVIGHFDIYKDIEYAVANAMLEGRI